MQHEKSEKRKTQRTMESERNRDTLKECNTKKVYNEKKGSTKKT